jgi:hypothetical protein
VVVVVQVMLVVVSEVVWCGGWCWWTVVKIVDVGGWWGALHW